MHFFIKSQKLKPTKHTAFLLKPINAYLQLAAPTCLDLLGHYQEASPFYIFILVYAQVVPDKCHIVSLCTSTGWRTKCHTIDCACNTFLLLPKHLTSGTDLILTGWKIVPNEEHVQCDHRFASQPLANEPLHL